MSDLRNIANSELEEREERLLQDIYMLRKGWDWGAQISTKQRELDAVQMELNRRYI